MKKHPYIPLSNSFMLISILGAIVFGWLTLYNAIDLQWGFTLTFVFIIFIIACVVSTNPE